MGNKFFISHIFCLNKSSRKSSVEKKRFQTRKEPIQSALKKLKNWIRSRNLQISDGFFELANTGIGKNTNIGSKFSIEALKTAFEKNNINISGLEVYY